jgi:hypothetical protein
MEARLGIPVALDNDANLGALGEKAFGAARGVDDLVYIRLSAGIGAGLIIDGRPYHGRLGVAGEVGHVLSDPHGSICRCGNRGCLETVASPVAVAALLERSLRRPVTVPQLLELIAAGDRGARRAGWCPRRRSPSVVVPSASHGAAHRSEQEQGQSDEYEDDADRPEDRHLGDEPNDQQDKSERDHVIPTFFCGGR